MAEDKLTYSDLLPEKKKNKVERKTELKTLPAPYADRRPRKRVGRGKAAGQGKTAGRGQKGQKSRTGYSLVAGFEGGQMPLHRRLPKRGFTNIFKKDYQLVNLWQIDKAGLSGAVDGKVLKEKGLISHADKPVKILGPGEIKSGLQLTVDAISAPAKAAVEKAGGSVTIKTRENKEKQSS